MTEDKSQTTSEHPEWRAGFRVAMELAVQLAIDQQSDDPTPGDWNAACRHIAEQIKEGTPRPS